MVLGVLLMTAMAASGPTVVATPLVALGLTEADETAARERLEAQVTAAGGALTPAAPVDELCRADDACVEEARASAGAAVWISLSLARVGDELDIDEVIASSTGVRRATRTVGVDQLATSVLSEETVATISSSSTTTAPAADTPPEVASSSEPPPLGLIAAIAGGGVAAVGLAAFGVEAATLEDAASLGADKERARTMGAVYLSVAALGVLGAGLGAGLLVAGE